MFNGFILPAIGLGLTATSTPGPLQAYLVNITLRYGWRRALLAVCAPLVVDIPVIVVVVFILGQMSPEILQIIRLLGGLVLLWIASIAFSQYRAGASFQNQTDETISRSPLQIFGTALLINALSPGPYLFWSTVNGPLLLAALEISLLHAAAFMIAFYSTFLGGMALLVFVFHRLGQIDARVTGYILLFTICVLIFFATRLIAEALGLLDLQPLIGLALIALTLVWALRPGMKAHAV